ncbi:MAG: mucoidy inhibitor MuiA family protein [Myxococcota bacterium]
MLRLRRPLLGPLAIASLCLSLGARAADPQPPITTKITAVTVYSDRAQVTRTGSVDLPSGGGRVTIAHLPGWIDEESVRVTLTPASAGKIRDVSVERTFLAEASEDAVRQAEVAVRSITDQLQALADEQTVLQAEANQLEAIRAFQMDKLPKDMATRDIKMKTFEETVDFVSTRLRKVQAGLRDIATKTRDLQPELAARQKAQQELQSRAQLEQRTVVIELEGDGRATLQLTYLTPGATWEPVGELRAEGQKSVTVAQFASVVQTTGEDWDGAALSFSTQRPTDTLAVPEAQALLLGSGGPGISEVLNRAGESFQKAQSSYSSQNQLNTNDEWRGNWERQQELEQRVVQSFEELRERGTTAHYTALSARNVRADGKAVRVPISTSQFPVTVRQVAVPEVSLNVVRTAELVNDTDQPILPGRIALFADGAFVGSSSLDFVAPGETFSTFLGVNDRMKLSRSIDRKKSSLERKGKKSILKVSFLLTAENLSDSPTVLELSDRVPVSQDESIEVSDIGLPDGAKRDSNGVVKWTATIAGKKKVTWRVSYTLEYPTEAAERSKANPAAMPAPARMLYEDIDKLEKNF